MTTEKLAPARLTYEDYCQLPNDGRRHELISGIEYMAPAPNTFHQRLLGRLYVEFSLFLRQHPIGEAFIAPYDVILSTHDVVQPDMLYVAQEHADRIKQHGLIGAPDLVVEVLSPSNRRHDEVQKRALYAQHDVREYWIIDPYTESMLLHALTDTGLSEFALLRVESGDVLTSPILPGFALPLDKLFA